MPICRMTGLLIVAIFSLALAPRSFSQAGPAPFGPCPRLTASDTNLFHVIYYDARQDRFYFGNGDPVSKSLQTGDHALLEVCHAHFGEQFNFTLTEKTLPEAGAPVRGLDDATGLIKGLPGSPAPKGAGFLESVSISTYPDVLSILSRLRSLADLVSLKTELRLEAESIQYARKSFGEDFDKYRESVCRMTTQILVCATAEGGLPAKVDGADKSIQKLRNEISTIASGVAVPKQTGTSCATNVPLPQGREIYIDRAQFICFVNQTNSVIEQFNALRAMIQQPPIGSAAADLLSESEELKKRIITYERKLLQVEAAIGVEKTIFTSDQEVVLSRLKKLRDSYKDVVTPEDIQEIALDQKHFREGPEGKQLVLDFDVIQQGMIPNNRAQISEVRNYLTRAAKEVQELDKSFGQRVQQVNTSLAAEIKDLYALYTKSETDTIFVQMLTWRGNTGVILGVKVSDSFKPSDLTKLESPSTTSATATPPATTSSQSSSVGPSPQVDSGKSSTTASTSTGSSTTSSTTDTNSQSLNTASTTTTTEFPVTASINTAFEVHKTYRFNIAAGVLFSSVRQDNFALRSIPKTDSGGNPSTNLVLASTGKDHIRVDFPVFLTTYVGKPLDVFSKTTADRPHFGTAVGFSTLDVSSNAYLGGFWQPRLGFDVLFGLHLARRNVVDRGIVPNITSLVPGTTTAPFHQEWKPGFFVTLGFDALTFKKLLAGTP
jgi:hypothetical protein